LLACVGMNLGLGQLGSLAVLQPSWVKLADRY